MSNYKILFVQEYHEFFNGLKKSNLKSRKDFAINFQKVKLILLKVNLNL